MNYVNIIVPILFSGLAIACSTEPEEYWIPDFLLNNNSMYHVVANRASMCSSYYVRYMSFINERDKIEIENIINEIEEISGIRVSTGWINSTTTPNECTVNLHLSYEGIKGWGGAISQAYINAYGIDKYNEEINSGKNFYPNPPLGANIPVCTTIFMHRDQKNPKNDNLNKIKPLGIIPKMTFIQVNYRNKINKGTFSECLREEFGHAFFLIPDVVTNSGDESIFNLNKHIDSIDHFSRKDKILMRFIAEHPNINGLDKKQLIDYLKEWRK